MQSRSISRLRRNVVRRLYYLGWRRYCPVCEHWSRRFNPAGRRLRSEAVCPFCGARERHRLLWRFCLTQTDLFNGRAKRILHFAPETCLRGRLSKRLGENYVTTDLEKDQVTLKLDITALGLADETFDVIICNHVLEHVPNDCAAMRELHRVLKPSGWAVVTVPTHAGPTREDSSVTTPEQRLRAFGQEDHVRAYGSDFQDRLVDAGFDVRCWTSVDLLKLREIQRMRVAGESLYFCTRSCAATRQRTT